MLSLSTSRFVPYSVALCAARLAPRRSVSAALCSAVLSIAGLLGCGQDHAAAPLPDASTTPPPPPPLDAGEPTTITETMLTVILELGAPDPTTGAETLRVTTRDGSTPVRTDIWLYTLTGGQMTELDNFTATLGRKSSHLMLPATLGDQPSGMTPADDGRNNGLMTDGQRATLLQGALIPAIDGTVIITLPAPPIDPIVVVAGIEDQRYSGAAAINADGTPGTVPAGIGQPEIHNRVSYTRDVAPIIQSACNAVCHNPKGPLTAPVYPMNTQEDLVNNNFAFTERTNACKAMFPTGGDALAGCLRDITSAEFLVEPGAPAISDLLTRSRPDELLGTSAQGLIWYGGGNPKSRYNATYGDRRMPSTTFSINPSDWTNQPTYFDTFPRDFQMLCDWIAQGAQP